ncbi:unnamed protein product [Alopecurus aequalis]
MSSPAVTPALPLLPVAPLVGESGYLRWKESVMLRLHTLGLADILSQVEKDDCPAGEKQRARDDALCRGHILATLSDRLLPAYAHLATAGAVWRAVTRTYDLDMEDMVISWNKANAFRYDEGEPVLEQLAFLQVLATVGGEGSDIMALFIKCGGFPPELVQKVANHSPRASTEIWQIARNLLVKDRVQEIWRTQHTTNGHGNSSSNDSRPLKRGRRQGTWDI